MNYDSHQMVRIGVAVPIELRDEIARIADREFFTTSSWVRRLLSIELETRRLAAERSAN